MKTRPKARGSGNDGSTVSLAGGSHQHPNQRSQGAKEPRSQGAKEPRSQRFGPGFQPSEPPTPATRPERASDRTYKKQTRRKRLYLCLTNTLYLFGSIRSAFGPRDLSPLQGEPLYWMFPRVETLGRILQPLRGKKHPLNLVPFNPGLNPELRERLWPYFDRPSGTAPLFIATQALRAWLLSACPSGTKTIRPEAPDNYLGHSRWNRPYLRYGLCAGGSHPVRHLRLYSLER